MADDLLKALMMAREGKLSGGPEAKIGPTPEPSWPRKILETITGYPADPSREATPLDGIGMLGAGLPFATLGSKVGLKLIIKVPAVFHGTKGKFDLFSMAHNDPEDTLGWMVHAAEQPQGTRSYWESMLPGSTADRGGNVRPITSSSENVLDIATRVPEGPDWEPIKEYLTKIVEGTYKGDKRPHFTLPKQWAEDAIDDYPTVVRHLWEGGTAQKNAEAAALMMQEAPTPQFVESFRNNYIQSNPGLETWLKRIRRPMNDPETFAKTGFDAVRYLDGSAPSWAFPRPEQLSTPWGTPLGSPDSTMSTILKKFKK